MTFGVPLFLIAMLAGAIPIVLHLINRQNAPVLPFSTLRFLQLSVQKTRRRRYIHDALLLVLRVSALVLLALALARPAIHRFHHWLGGQSNATVAIVLDNSASMATTDQTGPRWHRATEAVDQILDSLRNGDRIALLVTNGKAVLPSRRLYHNHEVIRQALATCVPSYERADLVATLQEARKILSETVTANHEIYVVTDMQETCWQEAESQTNVEPKQQEDNATPLVVVDVSGPRLPNSALAKLHVESAAPVAGVPLQVSVEIQGDAEVTQQRVISLEMDGRNHETSPTLTLQPGQTANHTFYVVPKDKGLHKACLQLDGQDANSADDRLFFAIDINPAVPVAIVKSAAHEIVSLDQAHYLERALNPDGNPNGAIVVRTFTPMALTRETLSSFAAVFCVNLSAPERELAQQLVNYVEGGGNVVWICGDNVDPVAYSVANDQFSGKLLPARLTGVRQTDGDQPDGWRIAWLDPEDRIVGPFSQPASLYQSVFVSHYVRMPPLEGSSVRVLARLDNGQPLLVQKTIGRGSVYLWATSMHVQWTNFPLRPLFLPFVARMVFEMAGANANQPLLIAGSPWTVPAGSGDDVRIEIIQPNGDVVRMNHSPDDNQPLRFTNTHQVGIYEATVHRGVRTHRSAFVVNPDPEESMPARLGHDELEQRLGWTPIIFCDDPATVAETIQTLRHGRSLWGVFLLIVLFSLVAEAFLSNRRHDRPPTEPAGRGRRSAASPPR